MLSQSYIGRSGQSWKVLVAIGLLVVGLLMFLLAFTPAIRSDAAVAALLSIAGIGLSTIGILSACLSVKCRQCHALLVWKAMREQPHDRWVNWLLTNRQCPYCEDDGLPNT
jgi:hypothetical protein